MDSNRLARAFFVVTLLLAPAVVGASNRDAWEAVDRASAAACIAAAGLQRPTVSAPVRFGDASGVDARLVSGTWPQPHMKGREGTLLCLYDRRSKRAEVQEAAGWRVATADAGSGTAPTASSPPVTADVRGTTWRATRVDGVPVGATITATFDAGGRVGGRSGCNSYSARYELDGAKLRVIPPMIGTQMACAPELMAQERRYTSLLEAMTRARVGTDGTLVLEADDGRRIEFVRAVANARTADPSFPQYRCGGERVKLRFEEAQAFVEFGDGVGITLQRLQPDATPGVRTYTNGRLTFLHAPEGAEPRVRMARGRMAPVACTRVAE